MRDQSNKKLIRGEKTMRKTIAIAAMTAMLTLGTAAAAFANHSTDTQNSGGNDDPTSINYNANYNINQWGDRGTTGYGTAEQKYVQTIAEGMYSNNCAKCHGGKKDGTGYKTRQRGPHGGYTTQTKNCQTCHTIHYVGPSTSAYANGKLLLPGATVTAVCNYCHDLTATAQGPYNMGGVNSLDTQRTIDGTPTGTKRVAAHRVVGLTVYGQTWSNPYNNIPGGDNTTGGGAAIRTGAGSVNPAQGRLSTTNFTCDSCHTPHGVAGATVKSYLGDSHVKNGVTQLYSGNTAVDGVLPYIDWMEAVDYNLTNRLLKKTPNGVTYSVYNEYNAGWCASCHEGRDNNHGGALNHPVDVTAPGYTYLNDMKFFDDDYADLAAWLAAPTTDPAGNPSTIQKEIDAGNPVTIKGLILTEKGIEDGKTLADLEAEDNKTFYAGRYATSGPNAGKYVLSSSVSGFKVKGDPRSMKQYALTDSDALTIDGTTQSAKKRIDGNFQKIDAFRGKGPACQQCHGSAREVEALFNEHSNPANMSFPHVSKNQDLLVETGDDFCTNCHGLDNLP